MSLEHYRVDRIIVQNSETPVYDAVRAMESNHVGFVVVADRGDVVGVLTDRDVALRVVGFQLDPTETRLKDVMTTNPAVLPIDASEQQALELMRDRHVRRIPVVEDHSVVGVVSMDDLILSKTANLETLREVIRAQLSEPALLKPKGELHPVRPAVYAKPGAEDRAAWASAARAQQTTATVARLVQEVTGLDTRERALQALDIVASGIVRRLTPGEAKDFVAQMPSELQLQWLDLPAGPDRGVTPQTIALELAHELTVDVDRADAIVRSIGSMLSELISEGELDDVRAQLPKGFREILG